MSVRRKIVALFLACSLAAAAPAYADVQYRVSGDDSYAVGAGGTATHIAYSGTQRLTIVAQGTRKAFVADVSYTRSDGHASRVLHARFAQQMDAAGSLEDESDDDPDFLTILNQPFAVQLDAATLRDVRSLRGAVPFSAPSPLGGAQLKGSLRPAPPGLVRGRPAVGVRFEAEGAMRGSLPQHPDATINGTIHMQGTAFYAMPRALLLALDATLTVTGTLYQNNTEAVPVRIVYRRSISPTEVDPSGRQARL